MRPPSRWERLLDLKPVRLVDHLMQEVAALLARELEQWPPPIESLDLTLGGEFASLFEEGSRRPSPSAYEEALRLAALELSREHEAFDEYVRNKRYLERGVAPGERQSMLFLCRWLVEQLLGLGEATDGRVKRQQMLSVLERLRASGICRRGAPT